MSPQFLPFPLQTAGGLAAGATLLAGGYAAYKHHEQKKHDEVGLDRTLATIETDLPQQEDD